MTPRIATLTLNPTIDLACDAPAVHPVHKVRTFNETHDPGGGGVNVARVLRELGAEAVAVVLAGGVTGRFLEELLHEAGVPCRAVPIAGRTRISLTVHDLAAAQEYRFVPRGPPVTAADCELALDALAAAPAEWVVVSGSLPPGAPEDIYARAAQQAAAQGRRFVLDCSGPALRAALGHGIALLKPSLGEFETLIGRRTAGLQDIACAAAALVREGAAERIAVTCGRDGVALATRQSLLCRRPLPVTVLGAVGAGDSFLAAMTLALARGESDAEALAWGLAAGAAAVEGTGTAHPKRARVEALKAAAWPG